MSPQDIAELQGEVEKLKTENEGFRERAMEQGAEVERLKSENAMAANDIIQRNATCARQLLEAGAEIERLRTDADALAQGWNKASVEVERLTKIAQTACDETFEKQTKINELRAEVERLRSALQKIADLNDSEADEPLDDVIAIARAALEQKPFQAPDTGHTEGQSIATKSEPGSAAAPSIQDEDWQPWPNSYNPNRTR
jgi:peptidoglycan hydrolase CwlO-like protein